MRFTLRENEWVLDFLNTAEWYFVYELPKIASGEGLPKEIVEDRLPAPIVDQDGNAVASEDTEDWNEFVRPDIEDSFSEARNKVIADIDGAEKSDDPQEWFEDEPVPDDMPEGPMWRVRVQMDHTEEWYSTLNQSRVLMNKVHKLADDDSRFLMNMFGVGTEEEITQEKALLLAQYEFYCVIQNILVENLMN